jgi:ElaB/YqjD/DUF883 family membrane-anchored ribosome-binding protein
MFSTETKQNAENTLNDARHTAYSAKHDFRDASEDVKDGFIDVANKAGRKVRGFVDSASEEISHASEKVTGEIRNNPIRSSAIALGIGVVFGMLCRR